MTETEQEYFQICAWRFLHPLPKDEYGEWHHILPKSCGGFDKKFNLVRLSLDEHYRCHCLLTDIFKENGSVKEYKAMVCARHFMSQKVNRPEDFASLKSEWRKIMSEKVSKGLIGHEVSEESRRRMAVHAYGNKNMLGHKHTAESRKKMSDAKKGRTPWNKGLHSEKAKAAAKKSWETRRKRRTNILTD